AQENNPYVAFSPTRFFMRPDHIAAECVLELNAKGFGFLRNPARHYSAQPADAYVRAPLIQQLKLREGMLLRGPVESSRQGSGPRLRRVEKTGALDPAPPPRPNHDDLTPIARHAKIRLETGPEPLTTRVMDLLTPIGKGQRGLIVAPPRTGKTILLQHIA